jgi:hypothetical protein
VFKKWHQITEGIYQGEMKNDKKDGRGVLIMRDTIEIGHW